MADLSKLTLPNGDNYNLKDSEARTIAGSITPIDSHTWTGVTTTANTDAAGYLYFAKIQPTNFYCDWEIEYRVHATMAGITDANGRGEETSYVYLYGSRNSLLSHKTWNNINNTGYRPYYNHVLYRAKQAGIDTNHKGHALGLRLYSSYNPHVSTYARTIQIDVLYMKNCTITWIDPMVVYASLDGTGSTNYDGRNEYVGTTQGITQTGDRNDQAYYVRSPYTHYTAGSGGIKGYSFILQDNNGTWQSVHTTNATTATNKVKNPAGFRLGQIYYMASDANIAAGAVTADSTIEAFHYAVDARYSFNVDTDDLIGNKEVYLVGELHSDGLFYLDSTWWTQTEPTSYNGKVYIPIGYSRLSGSNTYQIDFRGWRGAYWYKNGCFQEVVSSAINATSVNGKTVITDLSSTGENGLQITKSDGSSSNVKVSTKDLVRPSALNNSTISDPTLQTLVSTTRANRLAFLPADQIIIEQTIDGGTTWTDAGMSDIVKRALFSETRPIVQIPGIDGQANVLCGLRVTFTAMKYNVPSGTDETEKYNYWSSDYVLSAERYCQLKEFYFWLSSNANSMSIKAERATGARPNTWITIYNNPNMYFTGWSGADYISFTQAPFGGGTNQTSQPWNYRLTFMTLGLNGSKTEYGSSRSIQSIMEIRGYGDNVWGISNQYMAYDHMYAKDANQNVTFPANVTATNFIGKINNHTVNSDVPSNAVFTDTKDLTQMTGILGAAHGGTGYTSLQATRNAMGLGNTVGALPVANGGTGATTAAAARTNLGFGDAGSEGNPVYFADGLPVPSVFTWGVDDDQNVQVGWDGDAPEIVIPTESALAISSGGTGATTATEARTNLGLGSAATYSVVSSLNSDNNLPTGAAIKTYVDAIGVPSAISTTLASISDKVAVCSSYVALANSYIQVILANTNSANNMITLNINGTGAKPIFINGTISSSSNKTLPAGSYLVFYDGTNYYFRTDGKITGDITGKVNGHTVNKDVPSNAVFTDTTALGSMTGTLAIDHGGTGATTAAGARTNLELVSEIVAAADWATVNGSFTVQNGTKIYASAVGIQLYVQIKTTAAISNGTTLFTVNTNFRPLVNYVVLPIRSSATPYAEVGTVWIGSGGSAIVYGSLANTTNYYITGFYLL